MTNPIKCGPPLNPYLLSDCIEQFRRGNWPPYDNLEMDMFCRLLACWLKELEDAREVNSILGVKIRWMGQRINDLEYEVEYPEEKTD